MTQELFVEDDIFARLIQLLWATKLLFAIAVLRGFAKKKIPKIREYYGWVGPGLTWNFFLLENRPKIPLKQC